MTEPRRDGRPAPGTAPVSLGIDFGATGLRALFALPGSPGRRLEAGADDRPSLLCEPAETGELPVTFPSLKSRLGSGRPVWVGGESVAADQVVVGLLRSVRERVEAAAPGRVAQTVISVPARFGSAQRAALRDAAREAGLDPVRLVSDSMAAVIGHMTERDSGTCLVYGMGYDGFELGLVRSVRGHFRSLGYEGGATSGGRAFDAGLLSSAVRLLRTHRGASSVTGMASGVWQGLRARGQEAREALGAPGGPEAAVLALDPAAGLPLWVRITRPDLDAYLERHVRRTLDRARALLDQAGMGSSDVDTLLLVGGNTRMEQVRSRVTGLGERSVQAPPELLALGALKHAVRLAGGAASSGPSALEEGPLEPAAPTQDTLSDGPPLTATLVGAEAAPGAVRDAGGLRDAGGVRDPSGVQDPSGVRDSGAVRDPGAVRDSGAVRDLGAVRDSGAARDTDAAHVPGAAQDAAPLVARRAELAAPAAVRFPREAADPRGAPDEGAHHGARDVAQARLLVRQGRPAEATALLRDIIAEAQELLADLDRPSPGPAPTPTAPEPPSPRPQPQPSAPE
ncbi:Hsp70 family protein, partial [Streptomyces sp. BG9H]